MMNKFLKATVFALIIGVTPMVCACEGDDDWEDYPPSSWSSDDPAVQAIYGEGDSSGKTPTLTTTVRSITTVDPNKSKGAGDCKDGKSCSYLNNEDSAMENRNKLRLNAAAQGISLGQHAVALATESGKDVDALRKEIENRDDVLRMLKGIAKLQAQHLQKTNAITAMRAKLTELSAVDNIASGDIYTTRTGE